MGEQESFLAFWEVFVGRLEGRLESSSGRQFRAQLDKVKALARQLAPQLGKVRQCLVFLPHPCPGCLFLSSSVWQAHIRCRAGVCCDFTAVV